MQTFAVMKRIMKLRINIDTIVYVHAPSCIATGGVELLFQLVSFLRENKKEAYIVLFGKEPHTIHPEYRKYNIVVKEESEIIDSPNNIEVYTETMGKSLIRNQRLTQKLFWWLSVDNYYSGHKTYSMGLIDVYHWDKKEFWYLLKHYIKALLRGENVYKDKILLKDFKKRGIIFAYQSEYIHRHLYHRGITNLVPLSDYINADYVMGFQTEGREDVVLYNPSKGLEFTKKLIELTPDINWQALRGFSREQMTAILQRAKLYIDFGNHPGKDRLPRECAMNGCCIITGRRGSAFYQQDVDIPSEYKFDEKSTKIELIIKKIRFVLENYNSSIGDFESYRDRIKKEKGVFENQVRALFL